MRRAARRSRCRFGPRDEDLAAPGRNIVSTWRDDGAVNLETSSVGAVGLVAGAAALVLSYAPQLSPLEVGQLLETTSDDLGEPGWDSFFGAGRVNVFSALLQAPLPTLRFEHPEPLPTTIVPGALTPITVRIVDGVESVLPGMVMLHYRIADGSEQSVDMNPLGQGIFGVDLPPTPCEETLSYYFQAVGDGQTGVFDPIDAPAGLHKAIAVQESILFYDDFEFDQGWETIVEGVGTTGGWVRSEPVGTVAGTGSAAQPDYDRSPDAGAICFITGQNPNGAPGTDDVDGGPVRLVSPSISVGADDVEVRYALWHHTSVGVDPDVLLVEVSRDNGVAWQEVEAVAQTDGWEWRVFRLSEFPTLAGDSLRVRFSVADPPPDVSLTESAVDEFLVREIRCDLIDGDFDGNGLIDQLDYAAFFACMTGPTQRDPAPGCEVFDFDTNGGIDLKDAQAFQNRYNP
ncbi:MAG: S8 family serine peptidase [Planctomycetes bacterium]|nr:S8 family serine peptidase [Planctomycetota bacterium]